MENNKAYWIRSKNEYPKCSNCGYVWLEQFMGIGKTTRSNIQEVNYCPSCGTIISERKDKNQ